MKKITFVYLCLLLFTTTMVNAQFYVAPAPIGNDSNPGTLAAPFQTLEKAKTAMQGSTTKTTYLLAGTYKRSSMFILGSADNGTTWKRNPDDALNSVIIDGNGIADVIAILGGNNITIDGITIRNFTGRGIGVKGGAMWALPPFDMVVGTASGNTIKNCIVENGIIPGKGWNLGAIFGWGDIPNTTISHNLIQNTTGYGIGVWNQQPKATLKNLLISDNILYNVFRGGTCYDGGAIYVLDYGQLSNPIKIKNNFIRDYGTQENLSWGIYLDENCSNVEVSGNVVGGEGGPTIHIHGGRNNVITGNILDNQNKLFTEVISYGKANNSLNAMSGNVISRNLILSRVNSTFTCYNNGSGDQLPQIENNFYKNYGTAAISSSGKNDGLTDSNPVTGNPLISGATSYDIASNSPVYATPVSFPPLIRGWGPAGYTFPTVLGSVPSYVDAAVTGVSINPAAIFLAVGGKQVALTDIIPWNASNQTVNWTSSNSTVATVSSTGLITGVSNGTATITATTQDGSKTGSCTVTVLAGLINVALNKTTTTSGAYPGRGGNYAVDGNNLPTNGSLSWFSGSTPTTSVPNWIEIDLGSSYNINRMKFWTGDLNVYSTPLRSFQFQYWDGSKWQTIFSETEKFIKTYSKEFPSVTTSKVRLYVTDAVNWVKLFEIEVFAASVVTSLADLKNATEKKLIIFPNPVTENEFSIALNGFERKENLQVSIIDINGKLIYQNNIEPHNITTDSVIKLRANLLTKGIYIVKIQSDTNVIFEQKIFKD